MFNIFKTPQSINIKATVAFINVLRLRALLLSFALIGVASLSFAQPVPITPVIVTAPGACAAIGGTLVGPDLIGGGSFSNAGTLASNITSATTGFSNFVAGAGGVDGWPNDGSNNPNDGSYVITSRTGPVNYACVAGGFTCAATTAANIKVWWDTTGVLASSNPTDRFMVVNGAGGTNVMTVTVPVVAGKKYDFSAYLTNMMTAAFSTTGIQPQVAYQYSTDNGVSWLVLANSPATSKAFR